MTFKFLSARGNIKSAYLAVRIDPEILGALKEECVNQDRTQRWIVEQAIKNYINKKKGKQNETTRKK